MGEICEHGRTRRCCELCAAWDSAEHNARRAEQAEAALAAKDAEIERLRADCGTLRRRLIQERAETGGLIEEAESRGLVAGLERAAKVLDEKAKRETIIATMLLYCHLRDEILTEAEKAREVGRG